MTSDVYTEQLSQVKAALFKATAGAAAKKVLRDADHSLNDSNTAVVLR